MNTAIMGHIVLRFLSNPDALWVHLLSQKYLRNNSFEKVVVRNGDWFLESVDEGQIYHF